MTTTGSTTTEGSAFTAPLPDLQTALASLAVVPIARSQMPVLGGVLVEATDGAVTLSVFDYECSARVLVDGAQVKETGRILLDRADVARILRGATRGESKKTLGSWQATVTGRTTATTMGPGDKNPGQVRNTGTAEIAVGGFEVPVECLPVDEFPLLPRPDSPNLVVDRDALADLLARVVTAAGIDLTLPALTGVWLEPGDGALTLACTNRFQLAVGNLAAEVLVETEAAGYLLPATELTRTVKTLPAGPVTFGLVQHTAQHAQATVTAGGVQVTLRLLDAAEFPRKFRQLIPSDIPGTVEVDRAALSRTVDKATALAGRCGYVDLHIRDGQLTVVPRLDDAETQLKARGAAVSAVCDTADISIGFTGQLLMSALGSIGTERVALGLVSSTKPALLASTVEDLRDPGAPFRHLLMPVKQPA